jgi:VWFA-related protein
MSPALLFVALLQAQDQGDPIIKLNVDLIQIDVTVYGKNQKHVPGLTEDDFEVFRDGKRQTIKKVLYVSRPPLPPPDPAVAASLATAPGKQLRRQDVRRTFAIFIDDLSVNMGQLPPLRDAVRKFVEEQVQPGDIVAIYRSSGGLGLFEQFTTDKRALLAGIANVRFRNMNGVDSLAPIDSNPMEDDPNPTIAAMALEQRMREESNMRTRQDMLTAGMLSGAAFIVQGLRDLPGRKSMVIFSESIQLYDLPQALNNPGANPMAAGASGGTRDRTRAAMRSLVDIANRSGVTFYTVDPRGLQVLGATAADTFSQDVRKAQGRIQQRQMDFSLSQDGLSTLAEETGGLFFRNTNDLGRALTDAANDQDGYYLVAFQPDAETFEKTKQGQSRMHKLTIKVHGQGMKVRYRKSFAGVPDSERVAANANPLVSAMMSPFRASEIPMKLTPIYLEAADGTGPFIRAHLFLDPKGFQFADDPAAPEDKNRTPWKQAVADEMVVLYDQNGALVERVAQSQTIRVRADNYAALLKNGISQVLDIPVKKPGAYQVRAAVMDQANRQTGSSAQFVVIPDLKNKDLAMSDITLLTDAYLKSQSSGGAPSLRVARPGEKLAYAGYVYNVKSGKQAGSANLLVQIVLYREGKAVYTGPKTPYRQSGLKEGEHLALSGNLQLGSKLAEGEYVLQVAIQDLEAPRKHQYVLKSADFEVRAGS